MLFLVSLLMLFPALFAKLVLWLVLLACEQEMLDVLFAELDILDLLLDTLLVVVVFDLSSLAPIVLLPEKR